MREKLINNLGLKILSVFLAFFVWLVVMNVSNPLISDSVEVPLEIVNEQVLTAAGQTYEIVGKQTVTVSYDVHTRDNYRIRPADFRAYVDLAELYDVTGSVQVKVEILSNQGFIMDAAARPGVVRVNIEELQTKKFELRAARTGTAAEGYAYGGVTLSPAYVSVTGPVSQVGQISYAGVEFSVDGLSANAEQTTEPRFYDANGNELTLSDRMSVDVNEIGCQIAINRVKALLLDFDVSGTVADGYQFTGIESSVREVNVTGLVTNLAEAKRVMIPAEVLDLDGASGDVTVTIDVREYLPDGVKLVETEDPMVEVRMKVEKLVQRTITLEEGDVELRGALEEYQYHLTPNRISVIVEGLGEDLERTNGADLGAYLDVEGIEPGSHSLELQFEADAAFDIISFDETKLTVSLDSTVVEAGGSAPSSEGEKENTELENQSAETSGAETESAAETKEPAEQESETVS